VTSLKPAKWAPNEYAMISEWQNEAALISFVGETVSHYVNWD